MSSAPLVIDFDGTYIKSDTTWELCLTHIKKFHIIGIFQLIFFLFKSKANLKEKLAKLHKDNYLFENIFNEDIKSFHCYKNSKSKYIVSGSSDIILKKILKSNIEFKDTKGSSSNLNLIGKNKAKYLTELFPDGFDYIGNSSDDLPVWKVAKKSYGYNVSKSLINKAKKNNIQLNVLKLKSNNFLPILKTLRFHQWIKNLLIFFAALLNLKSISLEDIFALTIGFFAFGLIASSTYIFNDLFDIQEDRISKKKNNRPIPSGKLSIPFCLLLMFLLFLIGSLIGFYLNLYFFIMLETYVILSIGYSLFIKKLFALDVIFLSFLFCWRIISGSILINIQNNMWVIFSLALFFLSLAIGKRCSELFTLNNSSQKMPGRGYLKNDYTMLTFIGVANSFISVLAIAIYALTSETSIFQDQISIATLIFLIYLWTMRFWILIYRNKIDIDPVIFVIKDKTSFCIFSLLFLLVLFQQINLQL